MKCQKNRGWAYTNLHEARSSKRITLPSATNCGHYLENITNRVWVLDHTQKRRTTKIRAPQMCQGGIAKALWFEHSENMSNIVELEKWCLTLFRLILRLPRRWAKASATFDKKFKNCPVWLLNLSDKLDYELPTGTGGLPKMCTWHRRSVHVCGSKKLLSVRYLYEQTHATRIVTIYTNRVSLTTITMK